MDIKEKNWFLKLKDKFTIGFLVIYLGSMTGIIISFFPLFSQDINKEITQEEYVKRSQEISKSLSIIQNFIKFLLCIFNHEINP